MDKASRHDRMIDYDAYKQCVAIPARMDLCQNLPYSKMTLPNLLGHDTLPEVLTRAREWSSQADAHLNCHADARTFLCSLFAPVCLPSPNNPDMLMDLKPCHSLCVNVKKACQPKLGKLIPSLVWNTYFNCSKYTIDEGLCVPGKTSKKVTDLNNPRQKNSNLKKPSKPSATVLGTDVAGRRQCPICDYTPDMNEVMSQFCGPLTNFVVKIRKSQLKAVKRTHNDRRESFIQIKGNVSFFKNTEQGEPKVFYLKKSRKCNCDMLMQGGKTEYLLMGRYDRSRGIPIVSVLQKLTKNRNLRRTLRKLEGSSTSCSSSAGDLEPDKLLSRSKNKRGGKRKKGKKRGRGKKGRGRRPKTNKKIILDADYIPTKKWVKPKIGEKPKNDGEAKNDDKPTGA